MAEMKVDASGSEVNGGAATTSQAAGTPKQPTAQELTDISVTSLEADTIGGWTSVDVDSGNLHGSTEGQAQPAAEFPFQHGRRFHASRTGSYELPNDDHEQRRLNIQHHVFRVALDGRMFTAPLLEDEICNVLDIGCGTGIWCIQTAERFPQARVEGIDLSPIQPQKTSPNCTFTVRDANGDWPSTDQKYDLIHTQAMTLGITDWPKLMRQAFEALAPGGYLELHEYTGRGDWCNKLPDTSLPEPHMLQLYKLVSQGMSKAGKDMHAPEQFESMLKEAGFVDVQVSYQDWPIGAWAKGRKNKVLGHLQGENMMDAGRNVGALFTTLLGWSSEEYDKWLEEFLKDFESQKWQVYVRAVFFLGRKPADA